MQIARELFAIATGKVNDDDPFFDNRMGAFQEYFLFDYRLSEIFSGSTVFETFLLNAQIRLNPAELNEFEQIRNFRHSLFIVEKYKADLLIVTDIFAREKFEAHPLPDYAFAGFEQSQVFEGRLVNFGGVNYFTGAFIFHPKDVRPLIAKYVKDFLRAETFCKAEKSLNWKSEILRRGDLLKAVAEQRRQADKSERRRAIDVLNVTKQLVTVSRIVASPNLIMSIGTTDQVSPFVPETPFFDQSVLLQQLAYCEIRSYRYKHIDPTKVYAFDADAGKSLAPVSIPPLKKTEEIRVLEGG